MAVGTQVLASLKGCPADVLKRVEVVRALLNEVVLEAKLNKVTEAFHQFEPEGVTGVIVISESHLSVHTWPEKSMAAVDIFTCGREGNAEKAFEVILKKFKPKEYEKKVLKR